MAKEVIDSGKPLSKCVLWQLQEDYYTSSGISAWEEIPFYPTSNPFVARVYAELIVAYLLDARPRLDPAEPVYILEIGAGVGQFGFHVLRHLLPRLARLAPLRDLKVRYVLTDMPEANIGFWKGHEAFAAWRAQGIVDFARFLPVTERELALELSGARLAPGALKNPLVAIVNYVFDSLTQDLFRARDGRLEEGLVTVKHEGWPGSKPAIEKLTVEERYVEARDGYYGDPHLDRILGEYRAELPDAPIIFPLGAFDVLRNLEALSGGELCLLSSDKGFSHTGYMLGREDHPMTLHGCFSYMVNYDALRRWFEGKGGTALCTSEDALFVQTAFLALGKAGGGCDLARHAFATHLLEQNGIVDPHNAQYILGVMGDAGPREQIDGAIGFVRLCAHDPVAFGRVEDLLEAAVKKMNAKLDTAAELEELKPALVAVADGVRDALYLINKSSKDDLNAVASLYYALEEYGRCKALLQRSLDRFGPDAYAHYTIAGCQEMLEDYPRALASYAKAAALEADTLTYEAIERVKGFLRGSRA